jgi:cysteinyl-tRNA synthetase
MRKLAPVAVICLLLVLSSGCLQFGEEELDPEGEMRWLVQRVSDYARETDPGFVVIVANGEDLSTDGGRTAKGYLDAIDGVAREDLYFGWDAVDAPTPWSVSEDMSAMLNESKDAGKTVMVVDRCSERGYLWDAMEWAEESGFLYFASNSEGLDTIPVYPADPPGAHRENVTSLSDASNLLVLTVAQGWESREAYLDALRKTNFDVLVIDAFFNKTALTPEEVDSLRTKKHGGSRLVIAVMGLGDVDERQHVWKDLYHYQPPKWLGDDVPGKETRHRVKYWENGWRTILYKSSESWLDTIQSAGFDGVYLMGGDAHKDV